MILSSISNSSICVLVFCKLEIEICVLGLEVLTTNISLFLSYWVRVLHSSCSDIDILHSPGGPEHVEKLFFFSMFKDIMRKSRKKKIKHFSARKEAISRYSQW